MEFDSEQQNVALVHEFLLPCTSFTSSIQPSLGSNSYQNNLKGQGNNLQIAEIIHAPTDEQYGNEVDRLQELVTVPIMSTMW